ncbi:MAG: M3 family metallopeptidase [Elusimicrobiota bacterium]|jgi:thimet oligopeptidase
MKKCLLLAVLAVLPGRLYAYPLDFKLSSSTLAGACSAAKAKAESRLKDLAALKAPTFQNAIVGFSDALSDLSDEAAVPMFLGQVSTEKAVRDAGMECDTDISKYFVEVYTREDLFKVLKAAADRREILAGEDARLVEKTLMDFKRSGLDLPPAERAKLREIRQKLVSLSNDFTKEVSETKDFALFTKAQLAGLPEDMVKRLEVVDGKYKVTLDYPDFFPFIDNATDPGARALLYKKFNMRGGEKNKTRLAEILKLRKEAAGLLGYKTHADFVLEDRMAGSVSRAMPFLERLRTRLYEKARPELKELLALKKAEEGPKSDGILQPWDWRYYHEKLMRTKYQVDQNVIKDYFPVDLVIDQMLKVYQELLGVKFTEVVPSDAWHPDVKLYAVSDSRTGVDLGRFYMDLYPREGKYKHAAAFTLIQGRVLPDGSYSKPSSSMVANFDKPTADKPSLMDHNAVETLFHEFGHLMHMTLTHAKYQRFSGVSVARDFVETPSQMFENWVWDEGVLDRMSGFYKDRAKKLPKEIIRRMIAAKTVDSGLKYLRQNFFATYDLTLHTQDVADTTALYGKLMKEIALIPMPAGVMPETSFTHLMGYDAGYYSYLWSEVFAQDAFSRFEKEGLLNQDVGRDFRKWVLEPGGSLGEEVSLRSFLGREPDDNAFLKAIGIGAKPAQSKTTKP